jgi:hypothetical protein
LHRRKQAQANRPELGDQRAAAAAAERALALAEPDRLILPFAMTDALELLEAMPRHETAHPARRLARTMFSSICRTSSALT